MTGTVQFEQHPSESLRIGKGFLLSDVDPDSTPGYSGNKVDAQALLADLDGKLAELQEKLFAESRFGGTKRILLILQAMDTAGKGGIVSHVMAATNPQGVQFKAFKAPTDEEKSYDFLWRIEKEVPAAGMIGVFDRSHYEDVLIARVHELAPAAEIEKRYDLINQFEQSLVDNDTTVIKVMLQISSAEQKSRLAERLDRPDKYWKYHTVDVDERMNWSGYQDAYQVALERTSTAAAPWFVVPADRKWYARWPCNTYSSTR